MRHDDGVVGVVSSFVACLSTLRLSYSPSHFSALQATSVQSASREERSLQKWSANALLCISSCSLVFLSSELVEVLCTTSRDAMLHQYAWKSCRNEVCESDLVISCLPKRIARFLLIYLNHIDGRYKCIAAVLSPRLIFLARYYSRWRVKATRQPRRMRMRTTLLNLVDTVKTPSRLLQSVFAKCKLTAESRTVLWSRVLRWRQQLPVGSSSPQHIPSWGG